MASRAGFGPAHVRFKVWCLATWLSRYDGGWWRIWTFAGLLTLWRFSRPFSSTTWVIIHIVENDMNCVVRNHATTRHCLRCCLDCWFQEEVSKGNSQTILFSCCSSRTSPYRIKQLVTDVRAKLTHSTLNWSLIVEVCEMVELVGLEPTTCRL